MATGSRQDQYNVTVTIDGADYGTWDKMGGGEVDSEEKKYKPGGLAPEVSLGGSQTVGNITVSRLYDLARDHGTVKELLGRVGKAVVVVSKQPLDADGNAFGAPIVYRGTLKTCTPPEVDSESSDAAMIELEVTSSGAVG
jgi:hypothetical protein